MPIRRPARHRSRRAQRIRVLWAVPLLAAALAAGFYLTRGSTAGPAQAAFPQPAAGNCATPGSRPGAPESPCPLPSTSGRGGPVASTDSAIAQMAITLTRDMLNEKPPDDGHRLNILSSVFRHIGIAVLRDSHGIVWLTQDFSN
jgi:hypothetical protein